MSTTLSELTVLHLHRPDARASARVVAAFYEELALVHEHLAAEAGGDESARELALAAHARAHALELTETQVPEVAA